MTTKVWQSEDIRRHLQAVHTGVEASVPAALVEDNNGDLAAYRQGYQASLKYLADRFGIRNPADELSQVTNLRLKTWTRDDIKRDLAVARQVLHGTFLVGHKPDAQLTAYYQGIDDVLRFVAISFDIETPENTTGHKYHLAAQGDT